MVQLFSIQIKVQKKKLEHLNKQIFAKKINLYSLSFTCLVEQLDDVKENQFYQCCVTQFNKYVILFTYKHATPS